MDLLRLIRQTSSFPRDFTATLNKPVSGGVVCRQRRAVFPYASEKSVTHLKGLYAPESKHLRGPGFRFCRKGRSWSFFYSYIFLISQEQHRYCRSSFHFSSVSPPAEMRVGFRLSIAHLQSPSSPHTHTNTCTHARSHTFPLISITPTNTQSHLLWFY